MYWNHSVRKSQGRLDATINAPSVFEFTDGVLSVYTYYSMHTHMLCGGSNGLEMFGVGGEGH